MMTFKEWKATWQVFHGPELRPWDDVHEEIGCVCPLPTYRRIRCAEDSVQCQPLASHLLPLQSRLRVTSAPDSSAPIFPTGARVYEFESATGLDSLIGHTLSAGLADRKALPMFNGKPTINATPTVPWIDDSIVVYSVHSNGLALQCGCHYLVTYKPIDKATNKETAAVSKLFIRTTLPSLEVNVRGMSELQLELWRYRIALDSRGALILTPSPLQVGYGSYSRYDTADYTDGPLLPITTTFKYPRASKGRGQDEKFPKESGPILWDKDYDLAGSIFKANQTTHQAESKASTDAIADGEDRAVQLFKEFPAYYAEHAGIEGEETDTKPDELGSAPAAQVGSCMDRKQWEPYVKLGRRFDDDPRSKVAVSRCECSECKLQAKQDSRRKNKWQTLTRPNFRRRVARETRRLWQRLPPKSATLFEWHDKFSIDSKRKIALFKLSDDLLGWKRKLESIEKRDAAKEKAVAKAKAAAGSR